MRKDDRISLQDGYKKVNSKNQNAARKAIGVLEQRGFIWKVERYQDRPNGSVRQTSNAYYILEAPPLPISRWHPTPGDGGEIHEQDEGEQGKPSTAGQVPA